MHLFLTVQGSALLTPLLKSKLYCEIIPGILNSAKFQGQYAHFPNMTLTYSQWEWKLMQLLWRTIQPNSSQLKMYIPFDSIISFLVVCATYIIHMFPQFYMYYL